MRLLSPKVLSAGLGLTLLAAPLAMAQSDHHMSPAHVAVHRVVTVHHSRVTHRGLTAGRVLATPDAQVILPILRDGEAFASELRIRLDRAQVLVTTAQLVGATRAVQVARAYNSDEDLAVSLPLLQPVALSRETRSALRRDGAVMAALRDQIEGQTDQVAPEPIRVERFRPRTVLSESMVTHWLRRDPGGLPKLVRAELAARSDESLGAQLVISASKPRWPNP